jgi:Cu+-exporting ATPase
VFDDLAHAVGVVALVLLGVGAGVCQCVAEVAEFGDGAVDLADALVEEGHDVAARRGAAAADVRRAVFAALSVLVMGYSCAVGIAAPLAIVRGSGEAADLGIIMRTGEAFHTFRQVTHVLLDKTGTVTVGRPMVAGLHPAPGVVADELLATAAAAEASSEHPLAQAITDTARQRRLTLPPTDPDGFQATAGFGVTARIGGHRVVAARPAFLTDAGVDLTGMVEAITRLQNQGHTVVAVARDTHLLGLIALADTLRPEAAEAVAAMRAAGLTPVLITGDNPRAARHIAAQLGITDVHAAVLPDGKAALVGHLQAQGAKVAMVGDGINDAPALMRADVGVALGSATDIATESADIIIVRDDLRLVLIARDISRRAYRPVKQNVTLAFTFNGIGIPLSATGLVYPVWAMVAMAASVTSLFLNSIGGRPRLLIEAIGSVGRTPTHAAGMPAGQGAPA